MIKIRIFIACVLILFTYAVSEAQTKSKSLSDPVVVRFISGGFAKGNKLHLMTNIDYLKLNQEQKQNVLNKVAQEFIGYDITVYVGEQSRELWLTSDAQVSYIEEWDNDSLRMEDYMPLELQRNGMTKMFYYIGGSFNGGDSYSHGSLNFRYGTFLYKNIVDVSATLNLGYNKTAGESKFAGDIGIDSRVYLPFRIKNVNLAPYAGAGFSYSFSPDSYFELRLLAGACWFIGPGSLDIGMQYGTKSDFSLTLGYTFRIPIKKKSKE